MHTRDRIIRQAERLLREEGLAKLSLRRIATAAGIRAPSIYEHFASKEAVVAQLRQSAVAQLVGRFHSADNAKAPPLERLLVLGLAYVRFAKEERETFDLFFSVFSSNRSRLSQADTSTTPYSILRTVMEAYAAPRLGHDLPQLYDELTYGYWALVHGAALLQSTFLAGFEADFAAADRRNFRRYMEGCLQVQ